MYGTMETGDLYTYSSWTADLADVPSFYFDAADIWLQVLGVFEFPVVLDAEYLHV